MHSGAAKISLSGRIAACAVPALTRIWRCAAALRYQRYRPEAHYMRGPGPKWHAKHGGLNARQMQAKAA